MMTTTTDAGGVRQSDLAAEYGIGQVRVSQIVRSEAGL